MSIKWVKVLLVVLSSVGLIASVCTEGDAGKYLLVFGGVIAFGLLALEEHR